MIRLSPYYGILAGLLAPFCSAQVGPEVSGPNPPIAASERLTPVKSQDGKWGYQDHSGVFVIPAQFDKATEFSEGLAAVALHKKFGYIDTTGKMVIAPRFVHGEPFHEGLALVYTSWGMNVLGHAEGWDLFRRAGYIDHTGKTVIRPRLAENANSFSEGVAAFQPGIA